MKQLKAETLFERVGEIKDPRVERTKLHSLKDILVIAVCGTICGADNWEEIAEFGESKREWFATFLELENGIPSHDTFRRVFILLDNVELKGLFIDWISSAVKLSKGSARQHRWQEFARKQRADQRQKSVKYSECVGIGTVSCFGASAVSRKIE